MNNYLLLGLGALGIALIAKKDVSTQTVGSTGLTVSQLPQAIELSAPFVNEQTANDILGASDAASALAIGNQYLQTLVAPTPDANYMPGQTVTNAWQAVTAVQSSPLYQSNINPYNNEGGAYPRVIGGVYIANPNMQERLRIAWENAHQGFTH
jgi:hypothetical protein